MGKYVNTGPQCKEYDGIWFGWVGTGKCCTKGSVTEEKGVGGIVTSVSCTRVKWSDKK